MTQQHLKLCQRTLPSSAAQTNNMFRSFEVLKALLLSKSPIFFPDIHHQIGALWTLTLRIHRWPSNLSVHLKSTGFEEVLSISYPLSSELYAPFMQAHLCAAEEISFTAMKNDGPEAQGPLFRKLLADVYKECQTGVTMAESPIVVCGRKPASNSH